jgi:hypothetical protein
MEVAGLALGVYPIVCLLLDQYRDGAKYVKNYRRFLRNYTSFVTDIRFQQLKFEELLYDLMCSGLEPYLTGSISHQKFLEIARSKDFKGWNDPRLHKILTLRLDDSYDFTRERLNEVWDTFEELERLLQIQEARFQNLMLSFSPNSSLIHCSIKEVQRQQTTGNSNGNVLSRPGSNQPTWRSAEQWETRLIR